MPSAADISAKMAAALRLSEPDLDTSIGTPIRKVLDAVAEATAEAYTDQHLINYSYDVDSKVGGDLDDFAALFGLSRIPAQRSQGVVTFARANDVNGRTTTAIIPPGTQIAALTSPVAYVQTTLAGVLNPGQLTVDLPVQALLGGPAGNVAAGLLVNPVGNSTNVNSVTNTAPLTGGLAQESDTQLRTRFKATVFRSLAGTEAMYRAVALDVPLNPQAPATKAVGAVNVIGSSRRRREQVQIVSGSAATSLAHAAYIFPDTAFFGPDIDGGSLLLNGLHYSFTPSNPTTGADATATVSSLGTGTPDGLYDLDFEYVPQASRNDPTNTRFGAGPVNNRIDVWCAGENLTVATQSVVFSNAKVFSTTVTSPYYTGSFTQANDSQTTPLAGNFFIPLAYGPIMSVPATISIAGTAYNQGSDYWVVYQDNAFGRTPNSLYGLAWTSGAGRVPANGATFSLVYNYNRVPWDVQDGINQWRLVGTDARAHAGKKILLRVNLAVVYDRRFSQSTVNTNLDAALSLYLSSLGFNASVQVSDVINTAHNVGGVNNVRFLTSADDAVNYAISRMSEVTANAKLSTYASGGGRAIDVIFADNEYPVYHSSYIAVKAPNSFGGG